MLQKYAESDFELMYLDHSRFSLEKKVSENKSPFNYTFFKDVFLSFKFCNVVNIETFFIQRFFLVIWLFTGCLGFVSKYKNHLRLGKYYYHFIIKHVLKKRKFFYIISSILDDFLKKSFDDGVLLDNNKYILIFKDLNILTNKKLARGVYFHRIQQLFYININIIKNASKYFIFFLNSVKLCDLMKKN